MPAPIVVEWMGGPYDGATLVHPDLHQSLTVTIPVDHPVQADPAHRPDPTLPQRYRSGVVFPTLTPVGYRFFWNRIRWVEE